MSDTKLDRLEAENERREIELSVEEKKVLIAEAKRRYGRDWTRFFSNFAGKGSGMDWNALKFRLDR